MKYVVVISNNEGGSPPFFCDSLDEAREKIWGYLTDPDNDPPITDAERARLKLELSELTGDCTESVRGSEAWKEYLYVAPLTSAPSPSPPE